MSLWDTLTGETNLGHKNRATGIFMSTSGKIKMESPMLQFYMTKPKLRNQEHGDIPKFPKQANQYDNEFPLCLINIVFNSLKKLSKVF